MNVPLSKDEYAERVKSLTPRSPLARDMFFSFLIGGAICLLGQLFLELFLELGLEKDAAGSLTSVLLIAFGAVLSVTGLYAKIARFGGAGTLLPITGFSNSMISAAVEFKSEGFVAGLGANLFRIAGPVIVYGISAGMIYGAIYWLFPAG
ncbi:MAG: SpoVA/SpoVAEb family sporulation membrane protein [Clostridia bacterium]|nr:SpoVA/SpoVAEb family sporulation membrane protein [Clostridia bacterium]